MSASLGSLSFCIVLKLGDCVFKRATSQYGTHSSTLFNLHLCRTGSRVQLLSSALSCPQTDLVCGCKGFYRSHTVLNPLPGFLAVREKLTPAAEGGKRKCHWAHISSSVIYECRSEEQQETLFTMKSPLSITQERSKVGC